MLPRSLSRLLVAMLATVALVSEAKVSKSVVVCVPEIGPWISPAVEKQLASFMVLTDKIAKTYGQPEVLISSSLFLPHGRQPSTTLPEREQAIIAHLKSMGLKFGTHETYRLPSEAKPVDFGCSNSHVAIELEVLFKHPR